ncbi:MAG TPA: virulence factor [Anaerolineae bacterium]|nr:virulence factor [Anaerolineae bacterium]
MAKYQIMSWHDIPSQLKATDENGTVKRMLPDRFQQAIDSAAIAAGKSDSEAYLDGWQWSRRQERPGSAEAVVEALLAELDAAYPKERLRQMILNHAQK